IRRKVSDGGLRSATPALLPALSTELSPLSTASSLVDIEALPRERDEDVLEVRTLHDQLADADPGEHELAVHDLGPDVAERGDEHAVPDVGLPHARPCEHLDGAGHVVPAGDDHTQPGRGDVPELAQRAL